ncbi:exonuclease domain-containing protein [Prevotella sp. OH937_COT-195]|uniref:exonuclease domain-containing protein n=1 Tax=Prevotella sp. OH937_COT-195 TaxID=2491051 RepID=UPI000F648A16|nr:exonuclease domain-containing protein [Prevotella sp. OH937_COT-195]RRC99062.1 DNA polymerase III [Prevotella sp. OH937_COT-195]
MAKEIYFNINLDVKTDSINVDNENPLDKMLSGLLPKNAFSREDDNSAFNLEMPFSENGINFVAIDLETATEERDSICEIGIAIVEDSKIKETKSWLIQPPDNEYDDFNIEIHGIRPRDTRDCPEFGEIWPEILPYLNGRVVVSHNTAFDMYVLRDSFLWNNIPFPNFAFFCSYRTSTKLVKGCYSYSLPYVCETLGIPFSGHHRAGNDAAACAEVFIKCIQLSGCNSYVDLQKACEFRCGRFSDNYFRPQLSTHQGGKSFKVEDIKGDPSKIDEGNYFYGKRVCFTGTCMYGIRKELLQKIADVGGIPLDSVTKSTDILIVGQQDYKKVGESGMSNKQKKAMSLKDAGAEIEIMSEKDFLNNI